MPLSKDFNPSLILSFLPNIPLPLRPEFELQFVYLEHCLSIYLAVSVCITWYKLVIELPQRFYAAGMGWWRLKCLLYGISISFPTGLHLSLDGGGLLVEIGVSINPLRGLLGRAFGGWDFEGRAEFEVRDADQASCANGMKLDAHVDCAVPHPGRNVGMQLW